MTLPILQFAKQYQRAIHRVGLIAVVLLYVLKAFGFPTSLEIANAITFAVLSYILFDISNNTYNFSHDKAYEEQADMYRDLAKYLDDEKRVKEAILIQYSSEMVIPLLRKLMNKGASVTLYIQSPDAAASQKQKERIETACKNLSGVLRVSSLCKLTVYEYDVPASIRGVIVDGKVLAIGWYTYEYLLTPDTHYPQDQVDVSGHDVPGKLLFAGSSEFNAFSNMFRGLVENYDAHYKALGKVPLLELPPHPSTK